MEGAVRSTEVLKEKALKTLGSLPPFSPILNQLMATLAGENVSFARLGDLIEKDTVIAGNVLNLVNSALYARRGTVNSVRRALTLLGIDKVRNAVLGMSLTKMWSSVRTAKSWSMVDFNRHSAAVAILSDLMAQEVQVEYPEGAFVAGLLHDLGKLLIATALPESYERIVQGADEREELGFTHAELSAEALAEWNLPPAIQTAVLYHHQPESDRALRADVLPLSAIVAAANQYVNSEGENRQVLETAGMDRSRIPAILEEFQAQCEAMLQCLQQGA